MGMCMTLGSAVTEVKYGARAANVKSDFHATEAAILGTPWLS
jgi:hypothetical protein